LILADGLAITRNLPAMRKTPRGRRVFLNSGGFVIARLADGELEKNVC